MRRYFAYGANIDPGRMTARVRGARPLGPGILDDFQLEFTIRDREWGGGVANIRPEAGARVWGMLWQGSDKALAVLETYRGDESSLRREVVTVQGVDGPVEAFTFRVHQIANFVRPTALYMSHLRRAMKLQGFPNEAFEALIQAERLGPTDTGPSIVS
jgi:hypothetical protein